ncbi:hypothetical protein [Nitrococcus mobilis]|uniref:Uncharacterized protein n=1 Tax=Nitrococcus mobilis Nb-231 TaxID=314278 RepID=A4BPU7_9GAMM|nr:hypothetical protein [Nitrococcus mobilis]EAR22102.1 hypothetical protein NB231_04315 [Nitrococcus mobilis Nb-231]
MGINAPADYQPIALAKLFGGSELIVLGTIEGVGDDSFTLRATEVYAGSIEDAPVEVRKYADWTGGRRWSAYRVGQTVLLFLRKPAADEKAAGDYWQIRGFGGEGEMPIDGGAVFPHGLNLDGFRRQIFKVDSGELYGYRFDLDTFTSALKGYLSCFGSPQQAAAEGIEEPARECADSELASYRATSALHRYLASSRSRDNQVR